MGIAGHAARREPRSKGKIVGQETPFELKGMWALRVHALRVCVCHGEQLATRAVVVQHKTGI